MGFYCKFSRLAYFLRLFLLTCPVCLIQLHRSKMMFRYVMRISILPALLISLPCIAQPATSQAELEAIADLEMRFSQADWRDFDTVRNTGDLPGEARELLTSQFVRGEIAEWGEAWSPVDVSAPGTPSVRHIVSYVSPEITVVVYQRGTIVGPQQPYLFLYDQAGRHACTYSLSEKLPGPIMFGHVQGPFSSGQRNPGLKSECRYSSL